MKEYKLSEQGEKELKFLEETNRTTDRKTVFKDSIEKIIKHNTDPTKTYKLGINSYTDFTND
jgi:hypothetical protein